jgi:CBS domain-containing protein
MALEGRGKRVRIYLNEGDRVGHQTADIAILTFLRQENAAGATVFRAVEGFGGHGEIHPARLVDVAQALPMVIEWIDSEERVERLLPRVKELVPRGLITVDPTEVVLYEPYPVRRVSSQLTAANVMSHDVTAVSPRVPVRKVVELLLGRVYRAVPVIDGRVPVGIITNSDLVTRGGLAVRMELLPSLEGPELDDVLERLTQQQKTAGEIMTPRPVTVLAATPLPEVAQIMARRHLKRLPVVGPGGGMVGVVSRIDLLRTVAEGFSQSQPEPDQVGLNGEAPIGRVMRRDVPTVFPESSIPEVMQAVFSTRLNRAVVVDAERHVLGLVTDAELLERVTPSLKPSAVQALMRRLPIVPRRPSDREVEQHALAHTARELMVGAIPTASESTPLRQALRSMLEGKEKLIAVVDGQRKLVGVVDRADILRGLVAPG